MTHAAFRDGLLPRLGEAVRAREGALLRYLDWLEARFASLEPEVRAFLDEPHRFDRLRDEASRRLASHPPDRRPPLFGLPIGVKDIFHVSGFETHAGSQLPPSALQGEQAWSVSALEQAGALIGGKTVTTEFAYFAPGPTTNPHNPEYTPGGSSSGSAAAVAAGLAPLALGTQTIGSINRPAAFCGTVGFKPSYGLISTEGVIPLSPALDHVGFFAPDAASAAWAAEVLLPSPVPADAAPASLRFAIPVGPYLDHASPAAMDHFVEVVSALRAAGHAVVELSCMPDFDKIAERHQLILAGECARVHARWYEAFASSYHPKTRALIERGQAVTTDELEQALPGRLVLRGYLEGMLDEHALDAWITPAAPGPAPHGLDSTGDPVMNLPWTQSGLPSVTLPSGLAPNGLPLGLQVIARFDQDAALLAWAQRLEALLDYPGIHGLEACLEAIA